MAMKRRGAEQAGMWVARHELPRSPGHVFYEKLNQVIEAGGFDRFVEDLCAPYYAEGEGRLSIEPGVYFRMLFVGYFEGLSSQRGIAWRCADSLSLRSFLGIALTRDTPEHSSMTRIRKRLPEEIFEKVFTFVLKVAVEYGLLKGKTIAVDATTLEANAAMKSLVRRDTGEDWKAYVRRLAEAEGIKDPTDEELRRFDRKRKKRTSNKDWESATDPDSRVTKMKGGRTHLAYKAENAVDVESEIVVAAVVYRADDADPETLPVTIDIARAQLEAAGSPHRVEEALADKGYHKAETLQTVEDVQGVRNLRCRTRAHARSADVDSSRISPKGSRPPCTGTGDESVAGAAGAWDACAVSGENDRLRTSVKLAADAAPGSMVSWTSRRAISPALRRTISASSFLRCSGWAPRAVSREAWRPFPHF